MAERKENRFYNVSDYHSGQYYQLQKFLFRERYRTLSNNARVVYAILKARFALSIQNNWIDHNGNIFFYFDQTSLSEESCISLRTITTIMEQLQKADLICSVQQGMNKKNRLYLLKPELEQNFHATSHENEELGEKDAANTDKQRTRKNCVPGSAKIACPDAQKLRTNNYNKSKTEYIYKSSSLESKSGSGETEDNGAQKEEEEFLYKNCDKLIKQYGEDAQLIKQCIREDYECAASGGKENTEYQISNKRVAVEDLLTQYRRITYEDMEHVLRQFQKNRQSILVPQSYIRACLFNSAGIYGKPNATEIKAEGFFNFDQRVYDYQDLENEILRGG